MRLETFLQKEHALSFMGPNMLRRAFYVPCFKPGYSNTDPEKGLQVGYA